MFAFLGLLSSLWKEANAATKNIYPYTTYFRPSVLLPVSLHDAAPYLFRFRDIDHVNVFPSFSGALLKLPAKMSRQKLASWRESKRIFFESAQSQGTYSWEKLHLPMENTLNYE